MILSFHAAPGRGFAGTLRQAAPLLCLVLLAAAAPQETAPPPRDPIAAAVTHPDRPELDRQRDSDRKPADVLAFFGIKPGMKVADIMTGSGYYTELFARVVGPDGHVYGVNTQPLMDVFGKQIEARIAKPGLQNITLITRGLEQPGLPEGLDAVLLIRFYHDFVWLNVRRMDFNREIFRVLKPGGVFGVIDHHAKANSGVDDVRLHRIDVELVKSEIQAAGFVLEATSDLLRHPEDTRDWAIMADNSVRRDRTDRFILRFRKPGP
jgi:predicted methyltransferase